MASHHQLDSDLGPGCSEPPQCSCAGAATLRSGWLLRASGAGPRRQWRRCWAYLTADRMYHTTATDPAGTQSVKYIPLDRLPVRALPRGYAPAPGVSTVDSRQVAPRGGSVFAVVCGAHTHFFAAPTPEEAEAWVAAITQAWVRCMKHTSRSVRAGGGATTPPPLPPPPAPAPAADDRAGEVQALRRALADAAAQEAALRRELAQQAEAAAHAQEGLVQATAAPPSSRCQREPGAEAAPAQPSQHQHNRSCWYTIALRTSARGGGGTTAKAYVALHGTSGSSASVQLPSHRGDFAAGREAVFRVKAAPLGELRRLTVGVVGPRRGAGALPAWRLEAVQVTDESSGRTVVFSCRQPLGGPSRPAECTLRAADEDPGAAAQQRSPPPTPPVPQQPAALPPRPPPPQQQAPSQRPPPFAATFSPPPPARLTAQPEALRHESAACTAAMDGARPQPREPRPRTEAAAQNAAPRGRANATQTAAAASLAAATQTTPAASDPYATPAAAAPGGGGGGGASGGGASYASQKGAPPADADGDFWLKSLPAKVSLGGRRFGDDPLGSHLTKIAVGAALMAPPAAARSPPPAATWGDGELPQGSGSHPPNPLYAPSPSPPPPPPAAAADVLTLTPPPRPTLEQRPPPTAELASATYTVTLYTADVAGAGTRLAAALELRAAGGATAGAVALDNEGGCFVRGAVDVFRVQAGRVGPLQGATLLVGLQHQGDLGARWGLEYVEVADESTGERATFPCGAWLDASNAFAVCLAAAQPQNLRTPAPNHAAASPGRQQHCGHPEAASPTGGAPAVLHHPLQYCRYHVEIETSDLPGAGASGGHAYLSFGGPGGSVGPFVLPNFAGSHFQRGQVDCFAVEGAPDVGPPAVIELRHDGRGRGAAWHAARVRVENCTTGAAATFECHQWIDIQREEPALRGTARALPARPPSPRPPPRAAPTPWQGAWQQQGGSPRADRAGAPAPGAPGYRVVIHTARGCGAGTRARPFLELVGARGSSGVVWPVGARGAFGAGRVDVFHFPAIPCLGELLGMRVGTDGRGGFACQAAWRLRAVEVAHVASGAAWHFPADRWVDRRCHYVCWLRPQGRLVAPGGGGGSGGSFAPAAAAAPATPPPAAGPAPDARWAGYP